MNFRRMFGIVGRNFKNTEIRTLLAIKSYFLIVPGLFSIPKILPEAVLFRLQCSLLRFV